MTIQDHNPLILASRSPRRQELLGLLGLKYKSISPDITEARSEGETVRCFVQRLAYEKAFVAVKKYTGPRPFWVLAADTVVSFEGHCFGKPNSEEDAFETLKKLAGQTHEVLTGFCLLKVMSEGKHQQWQDVAMSQVCFRDLSDIEIQAYLETNEWQDKAGAYGIQGKGAVLVNTIEGSYSNIVGLPIEQLLACLKNAGFPGWWQE